MEGLIAKLDKIDFTAIDIDNLLDNRDRDPFDSEWMRVYGEIEAIKKEKSYTDEDKSYASNIREKAFMKIYNLSGHGELAEYVSDDFGLIVDSRILKYSDVWLDKLISSYENANIPCGNLKQQT